MENKTFTFVLIAILAVFIGVGVVSKQAKDPVLKQLVSQQRILLEVQNNMDKKLATQLAGDGTVSNSKIEAIIRKQADLEDRIRSLEAKLSGVAKAAAPQVVAPQPDADKVYTIPVAHSPIIGEKNAQVTITEFVDFECPFCSRFHPPIVEILQAYPKKVNYLVKNFPLSFHPNARPAAKAALAAAEQGKYEEMVHAILSNNSNLGDDFYKRTADEIGLDVKKFLADYKNNDAKYEEMIKKDMELAQQVNVRGTPTFYINGKQTMARDFNSFKQEVDKILK